ncbi:unnamed protein product [Periconia digitata]|uniref:NmrA-like domain-containing protein n=1 Tax=Periconia digitata TaxID=1303443 RepID=A0A9W4UT58_9PLEO|nr:unnamed protein product [Periconia digitata]
MAATNASSQQTIGFSNRIKNVAIVGATGRLGKFLTSALLDKKSFNITAITRSNSGPPPPGVLVATVDYSDPSTLVSALRGQEVLIITMSRAAPPDQQSKLIDAAATAGVPYVIPNEFGGNTDNKTVSDEVYIGPGKRKLRAQIEELGVSSWLGIVTSFWYEYSLAGPGLFGIDVAKREVTFFDDGKQRLNTITWPQIGRAVANLLSLPILPEDGREKEGQVVLSSYNNCFVFVSSFALNQREMLDSLNRVMGLSDSDWKITQENSRERVQRAKEMAKAGDNMGFVMLLYTRYYYPGENAGLYEVTHGLENEALGLPKESLDQATKEAVEMVERGDLNPYFKAILGK